MATYPTTERAVTLSDVAIPASAQAIAEAPSGAVLSDTVTVEMRKLLLHSSHYFAGLIGRLGLGLVSLPIFTRIFSVSDYGLIDFAQKILLLMTAVSKMGLQNSALRFYNGKQFASDSRASREYYSTMFFGALLTSGTVAILFLVTSRTILSRVLDAPLASVMGFLAVLIVLRAVESMLWSFLRTEERTRAYNISSVAAKAALIVAVCIMLLWAGRNPRTFFSGAALADLTLVAILTFMLLRRRVLDPSQFDFSLFRAGLLFGCPLILYEISSIVLDVGDRFLVRHYLGAEPLGLYSVAYGLASQANDILIFPLGLAILPIYMRLWTTQGRQATITFLSGCLDYFLVVAAGMCALAAVDSRDLLLLLASAKYHGAERLIPLIVIGLLIYTTHVFLCAGLLIHKRTGTMAALLACSAVVNIVMNCILLPRIGLEGAAVATLASYAFCILLLGLASRRFLPLQIRFRAFARYLLAATVAAAAASRIELGVPILNLVVRSAVAIMVYIGILFATDEQMRKLMRRLTRALNYARLERPAI